MEMAEEMHSYRILLVDDEEAITTHLGPFLERAGFEVMIAGDGEAALRLVDEVRCDVCAGGATGPRLSCSRRSAHRSSAPWRSMRGRTTI